MSIPHLPHLVRRVAGNRAEVLHVLNRVVPLAFAIDVVVGSSNHRVGVLGACLGNPLGGTQLDATVYLTVLGEPHPSALELVVFAGLALLQPVENLVDEAVGLPVFRHSVLYVDGGFLAIGKLPPDVVIGLVEALVQRDELASACDLLRRICRPTRCCPS